MKTAGNKSKAKHAVYVSPTDPIVMACKRKAKYATRQAADDVALKINVSSETKVEVYHCPTCDGFHVGMPSGVPPSAMVLAAEGKMLSRVKFLGWDVVFVLPIGSMIFDDSVIDFGELVAYRRIGTDDHFWRDMKGTRVANWRDYSALTSYTPRDPARFLTFFESFFTKNAAPISYEETPNLGSLGTKLDLSALKDQLPELELFEGKRVYREEGKAYVREERTCRCGASIQVQARLYGKPPKYSVSAFEAMPSNPTARLLRKHAQQWLCEACAIEADAETGNQVEPEPAPIPESAPEPVPEPAPDLAMRETMVQALGLMLDNAAQCRGALWFFCRLRQEGGL